MDRLDRAGWPPVFCFMQDAVWDLISTSLWDEARLLLGDDCVLEPSFFAWSLKPATTSNGQIGQSFGLPHRDYPASEAMFDDGKTPKLLNVWIPINDATLDNGCMYILPKEFDTQFARPEDYAHMRAATAVKGAAVCKLRFPLNGARAVPAVAGSLLSWCGNTIHWGASCSPHSASPPRQSIAMTFRRRSVAQLEGAGEPITREAARTMSANMRLALIARSLLLYNQWHTLKSTAVPPVIYDVTRT
jgi:ectoine hydroxylase-related dioxygenase (phytanoyl-CoA dioxygenase family)